MDQFKDILDLLQSMGVILAGVFYLAIVLWTYKDARKRIEDPILVATATATSMLPIVGVFVYMLLRPSEYLADVRERELEIRMMERQLGRQERCPLCKSHIDGDYLSCPVCRNKLRQECVGCDRPLDPRWVMCPFCEVEVPGAPQVPTRPGGGSVRAPRSSSSDRGTRAGSSPRSTGRPTAKPSESEKDSSRRSTRPSSPRSSKPATDEAGTNGRGSSRTKREEGIDTEPFGPDSSSRFARPTDRPRVTTTRPVTDN